jgi:hypothetical protein
MRVNRPPWISQSICDATWQSVTLPLRATVYCCEEHTTLKIKLRSLSPQTNIPTERPLLVGEVSANFCKVESVGWSAQQIPMAVNLGFLDRRRYFFIQVAPQLSSRGWVDPVPDTLLVRKSSSAGNRTRDLCICSQKLWPLDQRGGREEHTAPGIAIRGLQTLALASGGCCYESDVITRRDRGRGEGIVTMDNEIWTKCLVQTDRPLPLPPGELRV